MTGYLPEDLLNIVLDYKVSNESFDTMVWVLFDIDEISCSQEVKENDVLIIPGEIMDEYIKFDSSIDFYSDSDSDSDSD